MVNASSPFQEEPQDTATQQDEKPFEVDLVHYDFIKREENFRVKHLAKLSQAGVWVQRDKRPPSHQCTIIFDWDDTILCTSFLNRMGISNANVSDLVRKQLAAIEKVTITLFDTALRLSPQGTFIITNAMEG